MGVIHLHSRKPTSLSGFAPFWKRDAKHLQKLILFTWDVIYNPPIDCQRHPGIYIRLAYTRVALEVTSQYALEKMPLIRLIRTSLNLLASGTEPTFSSKNV